MCLLIVLCNSPTGCRDTKLNTYHYEMECRDNGRKEWFSTRFNSGTTQGGGWEHGITHATTQHHVFAIGFPFKFWILLQLVLPLLSIRSPAKLPDNLLTCPGSDSKGFWSEKIKRVFSSNLLDPDIQHAINMSCHFGVDSILRFILHYGASQASN